MMYISNLLLFLPYILHSHASPLQHEKRSPSGASVLLVTESATPHSVVTYTASRVTDSSLWALTTPTTLSSGEIIYPGGYEWVAGGIPKIPSNAPYPGGASVAVPSISTPGGSYRPHGTGPRIPFRGPKTGGIGIKHNSTDPAFPFPTGSNTALSNRSSSSGGAKTGAIKSAPLGTGRVRSSSSIKTVRATPGSTSTRSKASALTPASGSKTATSDTGSKILPATGTGSKPSKPGTLTGSGESISTAGTKSNTIKSGPWSKYSSATGTRSETSSLKTGTASKPTLSSSRSKSSSPTKSRPPSGHITSSPSSPSTTLPVESNIFTWEGTWSAPETGSTLAFPFFDVPTTTIPDTAATSEAVLLGGLFWALRANRHWITDKKLRSQFIDDVENTKDETISLFNDLNIKPPADPECSKTKRKRSAISEVELRALIADRSLISGLTDLVGDAFKLISCATKVVTNLLDQVKLPDPSIQIIETLTDTLSDIADDLKKAEDNPDDPSKSESQPSSTKDSTSSSSSCTGSTAVPVCTKTISLSTSFFPGGTSSSSVATFTTTACTTTTIKACSATGTTKTTIISTAASASTFICSPSCSKCLNGDLPAATAALHPAKRSEQLKKRTLWTPYEFGDNLNEFYLETIEDKTDSEPTELVHRHTGSLSSAVNNTWDNNKRHLYTTGLFGCTAVVIVSEAGVWFSHHWEAPSFMAENYQDFQTQVLDAIRSGDGLQMRSPFPFAVDGQILGPKTNRQIYISTPKDPNTGANLFQSRLDDIVKLLTGTGAPFNGVPVTTRGYLKPVPKSATDDGTRALAYTARSKVLIQYDNNEVDGDTTSHEQQAIYRVWLEDQMYEHRWNPSDLQRQACSAKQKRDGNAFCDTPSDEASTAPTGTKPGGSAPTSPVQATKSVIPIPLTSSQPAAPSPMPPSPLTCNGKGGADWNGMNRESFDRTVAVFAISHLCGTNRPGYTSDPSDQSGYTGDKFWFDANDNFYMSSAVGSAVGWWPGDVTAKDNYVRALWLNVEFSSDQTGCQPEKKFDLPSGSECTDIFYQLLDNCDTDTTTEKNGGAYHINGPNGCVDYRLWGIASYD